MTTLFLPQGVSDQEIKEKESRQRQVMSSSSATREAIVVFSPFASFLKTSIDAMRFPQGCGMLQQERK